MSRKTIRNISLSLLIPCAVCAIQWIFWDYFHPFIWLLFYPAVFFSAQVGGRWGGMISTLFSAALVIFFFMEPVNSFKVPNSNELYSTAVFILMGFLLSEAQERFKRMQRASMEVAECEQATEALHQSELQFRALFELSPDAVMLIDPHDPHISWPIIDCNEAACVMNGYSRDELIGQSIDIINIAPAPKAERDAYVRQVQEAGNLKLEAFHRHKNGTIFPIEVSTTLIKVDGRELLIGIDRDITERKQAATQQETAYLIAEAAQSAESLQELYPLIHEHIGRVMQAANFYIVLYDESTDMMEFVYSMDEMDTVKPAPQPVGDGLTSYVLHSGKSLLLRNEQNIPPNIKVVGSPSKIWLGVPLKDHGKTIGAMAVQHYSDPNAYTERDQRMLEFVSTQVATAIERKKNEEAMRQAERRNRALIENAPDGIVLLDADGCFVFGSPSATRLFGYTAEEMIGKSSTSLMHPEDIHIALEIRQFLMEHPSEFLTRTYRLRHKDGTYRWIEAIFTNLFNEPGVNALVVNYRDITEQKLAREMLEKSQASLENAQALAHLGSWERDPKTGTGLFWSKEMYNLFNRDPALGVPHQEEFMQLVHPHDRRPMQEAYQRAIESNAVISTEYRAFPYGREMRYFKGSAQAVRDENGQLLHISGTALDITENRLMEREIQERVKEMTCLFNVSRLLGGRQATIETVCNEIAASIVPAMQFPKLAIPSLMLDGIRYTIDGFDQSLTHSLCSDIEVNDKCRGQICVFYTANEPFIIPEEQDMLDNIARMLGLWLEQREAETAVRAAQRELEELNRDLEKRVEERTAEVLDLYNNAPTGYHSLDANGKYIMINQTELDWLGYAREEIIGRSIRDFLTAGSQSTFKLNFPLFLQSGKLQDIQLDFIRKDGSLLTVLVNATAVNDDQGRYLMSRSTMLDITERKKAEEGLRRSEAIYRALFENSNDGIFLISPSGEDLSANQQALKMLGYTREEYSALPQNGVAAPEQKADADMRFAAAIRGDYVPLYERTFIGKNGKKVDVEINLSPVRDPSGKIIMVQSVVRDITERKKAQETLRESEGQNRLLFEESPDAIMLLDETGKIIRVNRAYEQLTKIPLEKMRGNTAVGLGIVTAETNDNLTATLQLAISRNETYASSEYVLNCADGSRVNVESRIFLLKLGGINSILVTTRDITERKKYEKALRESRDELSAANSALEQASRMKDEFLASMSHELRTPLTGILGLSEALQLQTFGTLNEKQVRALKNIENSGRHLLELINDILDLTKIEAGKLDMQFEPCSASDICQASLQLMKGMAHQKKQNINFSMNPALINVRTDSRRLKQMLVNLLSNAVKFTPEGGQLGLEVQARNDLKAVFFSVWDKGIGIRPEDMERLFKPFTQLDSSLARQYSGTGLGLSLVQRMAELHGGSIRAESVPGEGSRFTIILPWSAEVTQPLPRLKNLGTGSLKNALVIEDNELDAEHIVRYLKGLGVAHNTQPSMSGALEKAALLQPSAILLDLNLSDGSGLELLAQIKADERTREIPVVIVSVEERRTEAMKLGAIGYLVKPFTQQELQTELSKAAAFIRPTGQVMVIGDHNSAPLIMIADDNEMILEMISSFLETHGCRVIATRSGLELLERVSESHPEVMLVDIQMPGMDGMETIRRLRAHSDPSIATVPIIAITALAMSGDREKCLQAGANEYMSKPLVLAELVERIKEFLNRKAG